MSQHQQEDISQQAVEAKEAGVAEIIALLKEPEDLVHLLGLRADYEARQKANKAALSNVVQSQVEAARAGMDLLDKSQRHTAKLKAAFGRIDELCTDSAQLIDNYDKIRQLSITHGNVKKVLSELGEIVDLPRRAELVESMLADDANFLPAFEALTVLEGTSVNAKAAWTRNADARSELGDLQKYLQGVAEVMGRFEGRLWAHMADYQRLAEFKPTLLVDCMRVIELQERLDLQYGSTGRADFKPKQFKKRMFREFEKLVKAKFAPLEALAKTCGQANRKLRYDQWSNVIVGEQRDYLGNLTSIQRVDKHGKAVDSPSDEAELHSIDVIEEEVFDEATFLDQVTDTLYDLLQDLGSLYDHVAPCFPPHYRLFETVFRLYHARFATVVDMVGQQAALFSSRGALRIMDWVAKYMETLRNLGVEEELVRLPAAPSSDPNSKPGVVLLLDSYIQRMETTVREWYNNILAADLEYEPQQTKTGTLRTPGAVDFFRILNEEIGVIEGIADRGEVVLHTAQCALRIMQGFQAAQTTLLDRPGLSLEMLCALLNNNVDCHDQSLEFADDVQKHLEEQYRGVLDVETACRGFLGVAKVAVRRLAEKVFNDPGLSNPVRDMFTTQEWLSGTTTATIVATLKDYFNDFKVFVEPTFVKRVAEAALEELLRRALNMFCIALPQISGPLLERLREDEREFGAFFEAYMKPERAAKALQLFDNMHTLLTSTSIPALVGAYTEVVTAHARATQDSTRGGAAAAAATAAAGGPTVVPAGLTPDILQKLCGQRSDLERKPVQELMVQAKEVWRSQNAAAAAAAAAARGEKAAPVEEEEQGGSFFGRWGTKKPAAKRT